MPKKMFRKKSSVKKKSHKKPKASSRQFYSEISKKSSNPVSRKKVSRPRAKKVTPARELLSEISKVGKRIRRRVKRVL